jgi:hypothetical protein
MVLSLFWIGAGSARARGGSCRTFFAAVAAGGKCVIEAWDDQSPVATPSTTVSAKMP